MKRMIRLALGAGLLGLMTTAAIAGGTLYFGLSGEPPSLDTVLQPGTPARTVKLAIHRGLVNYGPDGRIVKELAENYEISRDAKEITFHLRQAKFHDGSRVTAADVKASLERILDPSGKAAYRNELSTISSIEILGDTTVKIKQTNPSVAVISFLALPESAIVPAAWLQKNASNPNASPIGAGPFQFVNWDRGREIVVKKFPDYYKKGKPDLDEVHYVFYSDENTRVNALKSGDVDIIEYVPYKDSADLEKGPNTQLLRTSGPFMGLQFNTKFGPFSKPEVRQAIAYAVDRFSIINTAFNGLGRPLYGLPIPHSYLGYSPTTANYFRHDVKKAKELLAKAGYPNGFEARLLATSQYSFHQNTAIAIQSELAKIGIKVTLDLPDWATRMQKAAAGQYDFAVLGSIGETPDPDWMTSYFYGSDKLGRINSSPYFNDAKLNELLDKGRATVDAGEREKIYAQVVDRTLLLSPQVYFMFREQSYAVRKGVTGFATLPGFLVMQSGVTVEDTKKKQ